MTDTVCAGFGFIVAELKDIIKQYLPLCGLSAALLRVYLDVQYNNNSNLI
jgi:hypothetical protein